MIGRPQIDKVKDVEMKVPPVVEEFWPRKLRKLLKFSDFLDIHPHFHYNRSDSSRNKNRFSPNAPVVWKLVF